MSLNLFYCNVLHKKIEKLHFLEAKIIEISILDSARIFVRNRRPSLLGRAQKQPEEEGTRCSNLCRIFSVTGFNFIQRPRYSHPSIPHSKPSQFLQFLPFLIFIRVAFGIFGIFGRMIRNGLPEMGNRHHQVHELALNSSGRVKSEPKRLSCEFLENERGFVPMTCSHS